MQERINAMKRVSDAFKNDLRANVVAETEKINVLKTRIEASTDGETLKTDVQSITKSYRVFALVMPKANIAAAADKVVTITAMMSEMGAKLQARVQAAAAAGADVTVLQATLTDLAAKITSANAHAQAAVNGTATLTPDEGDKTKMEANLAALKAARTELQAAHQDIVAGRKDIKTIIDGLKKIQGSAGASASTTQQI
jgi:septation ring formation regulator EzrA